MTYNDLLQLVEISFLVFVLGCTSVDEVEACRTKQLEFFQMLDANPKNPLYSGKFCNAAGQVISIALFGEDVTSENIWIVSTIESLESLFLGCSFHNNHLLTANDFRKLKLLRNLRHLRLMGAIQLSKEICLAISELSQLEELDVAYGEIDDDGLELLKKMRLKKLVH